MRVNMAGANIFGSLRQHGESFCAVARCLNTCVRSQVCIRLIEMRMRMSPEAILGKAATERTHMTGNTLGKTTEASARYSYRMRVSFSSVAKRTSVACITKERANTCQCSSIRSHIQQMPPTNEKLPSIKFYPNGWLEDSPEIYFLLFPCLYIEWLRLACY